MAYQFRPVSLLLLLASLCPEHSCSRAAGGAKGGGGSVVITGEVGGGNYSYFKMVDESPGRLVLKSTFGDVDLFISDVLEQPTFDFREHNASATSCGDDEIDVLRDIHRPVFIAVYGHPRHELSGFTLRVEPLPEIYDHFNYFGDAYPGEESKTDPRYGRGGHAAKALPDDHNGENQFWAFLWDVLYSILHCIVEIML